MKILYYDCFAGISGDMNLAALIDLGVPEHYLRSQLALLNVGSYDLHISREMRSGITGTKVDVVLRSVDHHHGHEHKNNNEPANQDNHIHEHAHDLGHDHAHEHHHVHGHDQKHRHRHTHEPEQRNLRNITDIIHSSRLSDWVKEKSTAIFARIAHAEAKVHDTPIDQIYFHEVGAIDSIVDIVGAAICLEFLDVDKIMCSSVELGSGFVDCQHGRLPIPAPATIEIAKDIPTKRGGVSFEATTPTGAAILASVVDEFTDTPAFSINKCGYGVGHTKSETPNLLRAIIGQTIPSRPHLPSDSPVMIECNIDDMNPEWYDYIFEKLFALGADDVYLVPIIMKKSRPGIILSVLCSKNRQKVLDFILAETSTLGVRVVPVEKIMLERTFSKVKTKYGDVSIKSGLLNGVVVKSKPEYADCKKLAAQHKMPLRHLYAEVLKQMQKKAPKSTNARRKTGKKKVL